MGKPFYFIWLVFPFPLLCWYCCYVQGLAHTWSRCWTLPGVVPAILALAHTWLHVTRNLLRPWDSETAHLPGTNSRAARILLGTYGSTRINLTEPSPGPLLICFPQFPKGSFKLHVLPSLRCLLWKLWEYHMLPTCKFISSFSFKLRFP